MKLINEAPNVETWLNRDYAENGIDGELRKPANSKADGRDGITGGVQGDEGICSRADTTSRGRNQKWT